MLTCNRLDLQTLGSQPVMPKNLPDHRLKFFVHLVLEVHQTISFASYAGWREGPDLGQPSSVSMQLS